MLYAMSLIIMWYVHRNVSYYVYNHLVRHDIEEMMKWHNDHRIRSQKNRAIVTGKPLVLYYCPEVKGEREITRQLTNAGICREKGWNIYLQLTLPSSHHMVTPHVHPPPKHPTTHTHLFTAGDEMICHFLTKLHNLGKFRAFIDVGISSLMIFINNHFFLQLRKMFNT